MSMWLPYDPSVLQQEVEDRLDDHEERLEHLEEQRIYDELEADEDEVGW